MDNAAEFMGQFLWTFKRFWFFFCFCSAFSKGIPVYIPLNLLRTNTFSTKKFKREIWCGINLYSRQIFENSAYFSKTSFEFFFEAVRKRFWNIHSMITKQRLNKMYISNTRFLIVYLIYKMMFEDSLRYYIR